MIKERALELVAALRSGKYKQTGGRLRRQDKFCCLGVACDISGLGKWGEWEDWGSGRKSYNVDSDRYLSRLTSLPFPVQRYFGFQTSFGELNGENDAKISLSSLNDQGKSFSEIADFIERNWEQL